MFKNFPAIILFGFLLQFFLCFSWAKESELCDFNGFVTDSTQWEKIEFSSLLENEEMPGCFLMKSIIGKIAVANNDLLTSPSCRISQYVTKLIEFFRKNKTTISNKHKEIADLLDFIILKLEK